MRAPLDLRLVETDAEAMLAQDVESGETAEPGVFARGVHAPAGWPWEQVRSARLTARHEAPLPMDQMHLRLKRLTPWRAGRNALFAACYARAAEIQVRFEADVEVEGRRIQVVFEPPEALAQRARRSVIAGVATAAVVALLFVAVTGALLARAQGEEQLAAMEHDAAVKLQRAEAAQLLRRQSAALADAAPGETLAAPLTDLAWAMAARRPEARIEAWRWDHGVSRIQARGDEPPAIDPRRLLVREGPGLWRIEPEGGRQ